LARENVKDNVEGKWTMVKEREKGKGQWQGEGERAVARRMEGEG